MQDSSETVGGDLFQT